MIKVFKVDWCIEDGGSCVPLGPVRLCLFGGGNYYQDEYGTDIIPAMSIKMARDIVNKARPSAKITGVKILANLNVKGR